MTNNISPQLQQAQDDLVRRQRPQQTTRQAGHYVDGAMRATAAPEPQAPTALPTAVRSYRMTPLEEFDFDHLQTAEQRRLLRYVLDTAGRWLATYKEQPGLSCIIAGPVGTGKTTIAENLMRPFRQVQTPLDEDGQPFPGLEPVVTLRGRLIDANELMAVLEDDTPLATVFGRDEIIIIDDAGYEEIRYTNAQTEPRKRQIRYGHFVDWCWRTRRHLIVTTMTPIWGYWDEQNGRHVQTDNLNPDLIHIFGDRAFSRLAQMAGDFLIDTTGLPDYRPTLSRGGLQ